MDPQTKLKQQQLPIIDFTQQNLNPGTNSWSITTQKVKQALEEYGCFLAVHDEVCSDLINGVYPLWKELFDLPTEIKSKNVVDYPFPGYSGKRPEFPLYEALSITKPASIEAFQKFTTLMWPSGNDHFCESMYAYAQQVLKLNQMVTRMVFESYGVEKYYYSHIEASVHFLRLIYYREPQMDETNYGLMAHTDRDFLTTLHQNDVNGLEVQTKDGEWITVEYPPSSFMVMAGQAFKAWSNGRIHAALHRVALAERKERYSTAFFSYKNGTVEVPEELVDDEHPLKYKKFHNYDLFKS